MKGYGFKRQHDAATIALAMELRTGPNPAPWKLIARYLGDGIRDAVQYARRHGVARHEQ